MFKTAFFLILTASVIGVASLDVFAEISTDQQEYHYGDTVVLSGTAELEPKEILEIYFTNPDGKRGFTELSSVRDGEFTEYTFIYKSQDLQPEEERYEHRDFFSKTGEYTIHVISIKSELVDRERVYGQTSTYHENISFTLSATPVTSEAVTTCRDGDVLRDDGICIPETPQTDTPTIQDKVRKLSEAGDRITELENRVRELENEKSTLEAVNEELKNQVGNLQTQLENANAIMQEQLRVIMNTLTNLKLG